MHSFSLTRMVYFTWANAHINNTHTTNIHWKTVLYGYVLHSTWNRCWSKGWDKPCMSKILFWQSNFLQWPDPSVSLPAVSAVLLCTITMDEAFNCDSWNFLTMASAETIQRTLLGNTCRVLTELTWLCFILIVLCLELLASCLLVDCLLGVYLTRQLLMSDFCSF